VAGFENERTVVGTLLNANWTTTSIAWPGATFATPSRTSDPTAPAAWVAFDLENLSRERLTPAWVQSNDAAEIEYYEEELHQGDSLIRQRVDDLMAIFNDAADVDGSIYFDEPFLEPSTIQYPGAKGEWRQVTIRVPIRRFNDLTTTEILRLAGQGDTQIVITESAHGFAVGDFVGESSGTWSKAIADGVGVLSSGVVSTVIDVDTFVLTTVGAVKIASHGWSAGPLYLDQSTAGDATSSSPVTGIRQQVALAVDTDNIIVNQYIAENLG
jgi:hypothetical protein